MSESPAKCSEYGIGPGLLGEARQLIGQRLEAAPEHAVEWHECIPYLGHGQGKQRRGAPRQEPNSDQAGQSRGTNQYRSCQLADQHGAGLGCGVWRAGQLNEGIAEVEHEFRVPIGNDGFDGWPPLRRWRAGQAPYAPDERRQIRRRGVFFVSQSMDRRLEGKSGSYNRRTVSMYTFPLIFRQPEWKDQMRIEPAVVLTVAIWWAPALAVPVSGQTPAVGMDAIEFMVGCWAEQPNGDSGLREMYAPPAPNLMTGLSQFWREGRVVDFEFHRIDASPDGPVLTPHPRGVASVQFEPAEIGADRIVWQNLEHDFPQRISYTRVGADTLVARIEGGEGGEARALEWRMARAICPN